LNVERQCKARYHAQVIVTQRGFTLLELLVTLLIASLLVGLAAPRFQKSVTAMQLRQESREVATVLRRTRGLAIARAAAVEVLVDPQAGSISTGSDDPLYLAPDDVALVLPGSAVPADAKLRIGFYPDGSSTGGQFRLTAGDREYGIVVDWLTGRVGAN